MSDRPQPDANASEQGRGNGIVPWVEYDPATGRIITTGNMDFDFVVQRAATKSIVIAPATIGLHYVDLATLDIVPLRTMTPAVNGTVISGLPPACRVIVLQEVEHIRAQVADFVCDDGTAELEIPLRGRYWADLSAPTYQTTTVEIVVA